MPLRLAGSRSAQNRSSCNSRHSVRMSQHARRAAYLRVAERAAAGDAKALDYLLSLESEERVPGPDQPPSKKDLELLQGFFDRRRAGAPQQVQSSAEQQQPHNTEKENT